MSRQPAQLPLSFRIFRSIAIGALVFGLGFVIVSVVMSDRPRSGFSAGDSRAPIWGVSAIFLIVFVHLWVVLRARRLMRNSAGDLVVFIPLAAYLIASLAVILLHVFYAILTAFGVPGFGPTNLLYTIGGLGMMFLPIVIVSLLIRPMLAYSIPSNWISVIPLVISYVAALSAAMLVASVFDERTLQFFLNFLGFEERRSVGWVMFVFVIMILCYYVALGGVMFPTHRKLGNLWRPKPLPKLPHRPIPAQEAKL
ncbi:MAG: hypothetical protein ABFD69_05735 [Candidatus Sumerlaeia bacterium]